jgi:hypothetical protein
MMTLAECEALIRRRQIEDTCRTELRPATPMDNLLLDYRDALMRIARLEKHLSEARKEE